MIKPASLRAAITAAVPHLQTNPEDLHVFIEEGSLRTTMFGGLSSEYSYTLSIIVLDYADSASMLFIPIMNWLRTHQPDMLLNPERMKEGFAFEVDYLSHDKCDIKINLKLTERVIVTLELFQPDSHTPGTPGGSGGSGPGSGSSGGNTDGTIPPTPEGMTGPATIATITHKPDSNTDPLMQIERWTLYIGDQKIQEWDTKPFDGPVTPRG